jgi:hypothetical protein
MEIYGTKPKSYTGEIDGATPFFGHNYYCDG